MESWRTVWREGLAPLLSDAGLEALRKALATDDPRLMQGCTTSPPPLLSVQDWPVEGACLTGLPGWLGYGLETVGEVEEYFARICFAVDQAIGEPAACRFLINFWDDTPREEAIRELLPEVVREIQRRKETVHVRHLMGSPRRAISGR